MTDTINKSNVYFDNEGISRVVGDSSFIVYKENDYDVSRAKERLAIAKRELLLKKEYIKSAEEKLKATPTKEAALKILGEDLAALKRLKLRALIPFDKYPNSLIGLTEMIKRKGKNIGYFKFIIFLRSDSCANPYMLAVNYYKREGEQYDHPCISNGDICWGDRLSKVVPKLISEYRIYELLELFIDFVAKTPSRNGYVSWREFNAEAARVEEEFEHSLFLPRDSIPFHASMFRTIQEGYFTRAKIKELNDSSLRDYLRTMENVLGVLNELPYMLEEKKKTKAEIEEYVDTYLKKYSLASCIDYNRDIVEALKNGGPVDPGKKEILLNTIFLAAEFRKIIHRRMNTPALDLGSLARGTAGSGTSGTVSSWDF